MKNPRRVITCILLGAAGLGSGAIGCVSLDPAGDYQRAAGHVVDAIGDYETFDPQREAEYDRRIDEIVADGLTIEEAVQTALLNNPLLRAAYARVGMARADVAQSRLPSNPVLGFSLMFPDGGGRSNLQASIAQSIVEIWQIPIRARAAERDLDSAILRLASDAARTAIDAKSAYYRAVGADAALEIARQNRDLAQRLVDVAVSRREAGAVGELDVNLARGTLLAAELDVTQARLEAATERRRLAVLLGLTLPIESVMLLTSLDQAVQVSIDPEVVVSVALRRRLDLRAAEQAVHSASARVELEQASVFPSISLGAQIERNERLPGGSGGGDEIDAITGPSLSIELPIFDQNQARIRRARHAHAESARVHESIRRAIIQESRQAADDAVTAREIVIFYDEAMLPQTEQSLELSRATYQAGRTSLVTVLEAQQALLTARRAAVAARRTAAVTSAELERVVGAPLERMADHTHVPASTTDSDTQEQRHVQED